MIELDMFAISYRRQLLLPLIAALTACSTAPPLPPGDPKATTGIVVKSESIAATPQWMGRPEIVRAQTGPVTHAIAQEMGRYHQLWIRDSVGEEYQVASPKEFSAGDCVRFSAVWAHSNQRIWTLGAAQVEKSGGCAVSKP